MTQQSFQKKLKAARRLAAGERAVEACERFAELVTLFPRHAALWLEYGAVAVMARRHDTAEAARRQVRELAAGEAKILLQLGHQYRAARNHPLARECYLQAAKADPGDVNALISLAVLLERSHEFAEARTVLERCRTVSPDDEQAAYLTALLDRREDKAEEAERGLRRLIASSPRHPYVCYACYYELAQVLDRSGRYDEAMAALAEAKARVGKLADVAELYRVYDATAAHALQVKNQPTNQVREWAKRLAEPLLGGAAPVAFLGGHPRSGTTLMEQVLGAHPQIAALDEPRLFSTVLLPRMQQGPAGSSAGWAAARREYLAECAREFGSDLTGKLVLDKNPSLTAALPLWLRIFPELRVIIALRDPRDVVLSCYFQNLPLNVANANFLSLERTARHYAGLMDVWLAVKRWEDFAWRETRYEDTVGDLEREGRRITEFLALPWDPAQARFYGNRRPINSPSYHDVSRPVHAESLGRWRRYEKYLAPVFPILAPYCRAFGYD